MLTPNQNLQKGRYQIINPLEANETQTEYVAFDNFLKTNILLREIRNVSVSEPRVVQISNTLTGIQHNSFIKFHNYFSEFNSHFVAVEQPDGNTLSEIVERQKKPCPLSDIINWAEQMLDGLNYLHTQDPPIFLGSVSPQNIRLTRQGQIKLPTDEIFQNLGDQENSNSLRQQLDAISLAFSPLEQIWVGLDQASQKVILNSFDEQSQKILEKPQGVRGDIFGLCATLYYLATARLPVDALSRSIEMLEGKSDPLQSPNNLNPSIPREISDILMKGLEIRRENRFSSATILRQILRASIAKSKSREMSQANDQAVENMLEIPAKVSKPSEPKLVNKQIEIEQKSQLELIKQQLREAEVKRLEAEKRAIEAEKRLLEKESQSSNQTIHPTKIEQVENASSKYSVAETTLPEFIQLNSTIESSTDDFGDIFSQPASNNRSFVKMAVGAVVLLVLSGAAWGIWSFSNSNTIKPEQISSFNSTVAPAPTAENTPASTMPAEVVTQPEADSQIEENPASSPIPNQVKPAVNPTVIKTKAATTPTPTQAVKKPTPQPNKVPETKKKPTLDDLIKDN